MKGPLSIIRWKFVIPTTIFVGAIVVFFVIFFDPLLAKAIESVGSNVNGAKVEVDGLKTKIFKGRLDIGRLQVTNKEKPMENIVEGGPLAFDLRPFDLLKKCVVIDEASLEGLKFNTERKTSGALPKVDKKEEGKPGLASRLADKYKGRFMVNLDGMKEDAQAKIEFDQKDLLVVKKSEELKTKAEAAPDAWDAKIDGLRVEDRLKEIEAQLKEVKETKIEGADALTKLPEALNKLKKAKADLNQLKADVQNTRNELTSEIKNVKAGVLSLPDAKKEDIANLLGRLNLDFADPDRLMQGMIGPAVLSRFQSGIQYIEIARKHMPSAKEKASLPPKPREEGMNIEFPGPGEPPRFWLVKAALSGAYQDITARGDMVHLTSDPSRVGKPFKAIMKGDKGPIAFSLVGLFDHVGDISKDSLSVDVDGLDVKGLLKEGFLGDSLSAGTGRAEAMISLVGENTIGGNIRLILSRLKFDDAKLLTQVGITHMTNLSRADSFKADFMKNVARSMEKMPAINVDAKLAGTWQDPDLSISSNLTSALGNVIKESLGNAIKEQRAKLEAELNQIVQTKTAELNAKLASLQGKLDGKLGGLDTRIQEKINEATGINLGGGKEGGSSPVPGIKIPSLDKLFKK